MTRKARSLESLGKFPIILAEPLRHFDSPKFNLEKLSKIPINEIIPEDGNCTLFMWSPSKLLMDALFLISEWNFYYRDSLIWRKGYVMGHENYTGKYDYLLIATYKRMPEEIASEKVDTISKKIDDYAYKADVLYATINELYPKERKLQLFLKNPRTGWENWMEL